MKKRILKLFLLLSGLSIVLYLYSPDISVSELKKTYANQHSQFIEIEGMNVHYRDEGEGQAIVLLHGTGASLHTWDKWTAELKKSYRVIRLDLPAYGLTGPHPENKYSLPDYSSFLNSFVDSIGVDNFILSGNSLGGAIAWYYTTEYQNKVKLLSLLDPGGFYNKEKQSPLVFRLARAPGINKILRYVTPRFFIKNTLKEVYYDKTKLTDKKIDTYRDLILRENNRESFINRTNSSPVDYTQRLKSIVIPTQILWGNEDEWISVDNAKLFSEALPNNRVDIMKETGHLPMEERPYESLELLLNFINEN
ncbi:alpha/beta hydrolase [bacterium]|jgi:pimeloyl-ACP methyl ester carboxylesterase|nr:alpha/beta hydrolase [Flavobacteriaceae bacterium]MDB0041140.1 alpha/beta hydrolase [bacterium]MDA8733929.1 alpha/beta hydrolase [Flavobacteriaceae bacterium]MDA9213443.1 alpha/beta hydrolase [Flavobacteriaceae bacterium]MDA9374729.1 alpha/beta hydrolase [Flavobacteriaceae bacterium]